MLISFEINPLKSWNWVEKENANSYYYKKLGRTVNEQKQKKKNHTKSQVWKHIHFQWSLLYIGSSAQFHQDMNQINTVQRKYLIISHLAYKRSQSR